MKQAKISVKEHDKEKNILECNIDETHTFVINALRRVIIAELDCVGIPDTYKENGDNTPGVFIKENTGRLHNEIIRHRLSMLPIKISLPEIQEYDYKFTLNAENTSSSTLNVYSSDIKIFKKKKRLEPLEYHKLLESQSEDEKLDIEKILKWEEIDGSHTSRKGIIPTDTILDSSEITKKVSTKKASILITRLFRGESLTAEMFPTVSYAHEFAGFSPISKCTYMHKIDDKKKDAKWKHIMDVTKEQIQDKDELEKKIEILKKQFENHGKYLCKNENDFHFILETIGTYSCSDIIKMGIEKIISKLEFIKCFLTKNIEINLGNNYPCLSEWVNQLKEIKVDKLPCILKVIKSGLHIPQYSETLVVASSEPIYKFTNIEELPRIDGEDIQVSDKILLKNQEKYSQNGIYLVHSVKGKYSLIKEGELKNNHIYMISRGAKNRGSWFLNSTINACYTSKLSIELPSILSSKESNIRFNINDDIDEIIICGDKEESINITSINIERFNLNIDVDKSDTLSSSSHKINIEQEDHTIGNLIQGYIYEKYCNNTKDSVINAIAYRKPHPLESFIELRIDYKKNINKKEMVEFVIKEIQSIINDFSKLYKNWNSIKL